LDMNSGGEQARRLMEILEEEPGVKLLDLHIWRLGPGHFGAIVSLIAEDPAPPEHYKARLAALAGLSHLTVEVHRAGRGTGRDAAVSTSLEY